MEEDGVWQNDRRANIKKAAVFVERGGEKRKWKDRLSSLALFPVSVD